MLKSTDVLLEVRNRLKSKYDLSVYLDDSKENCDSPCFFLSMYVNRKQINRYLFKCNANLYITYFSEKNQTDSFEMYQIKDDIEEMFSTHLKVKDRCIKFHNLECETDGEDADIIYFTFKYEYIDNMTEDKEEHEITNHVFVTEVEK